MPLNLSLRRFPNQGSRPRCRFSLPVAVAIMLSSHSQGDRPMNAPVRHMPWIGGASDAPGASFSPLVCPIDDTVSSQIVESDTPVIDAAVKHAHAAYLKHQGAPVA